MKIGEIDVYGVIYKITNKINKKVYIGQTTTGFKKRYNKHAWWIKTHNLHLKSSIEKYGVDNFDISEIYDVAFSKVELDIKEKLYISIYKSNNRIFGYNKKEGGANGKHSEESILKMSLAQKGKKATIETRRKMSKSRKGTNSGKNNPMYGKNPLTYMNRNEYEQLIKDKSQRMKGEMNPMFGRVGELNPFYGEKHTELTRNIISKKAKGRYKDRSKNPNSKAIKLYTSDGVFINDFNSFKSCSEWFFENGIIKNIRTGEDAISKSVKNNKTYKGFTFKYVD